MGHNSVVLGNPKSTGIPWVDRLLMGPLDLGHHMCGLSMACLWPGFGLNLDNLGAGSGVVLCLSGGMFVWLVMVVCVDCFVGISYATIVLENQVVFTCF